MDATTTSQKCQKSLNVRVYDHVCVSLHGSLFPARLHPLMFALVCSSPHCKPKKLHLKKILYELKNNKNPDLSCFCLLLSVWFPTLTSLHTLFSTALILFPRSVSPYLSLSFASFTSHFFRSSSLFLSYLSGLILSPPCLSTWCLFHCQPGLILEALLFSLSQPSAKCLRRSQISCFLLSSIQLIFPFAFSHYFRFLFFSLKVNCQCSWCPGFLKDCETSSLVAQSDTPVSIVRWYFQNLKGNGVWIEQQISSPCSKKGLVMPTWPHDPLRRRW